MGRPRTRPLPEGIYERVFPSGNRKYYFSIELPSGQRARRPGGATVDAALAAKRNAELAAAAGADVGTGAQTIRQYSKRFLEQHRARGVRTVDREEQVLEDHVLPYLGDVALTELRPRQVRDWILTLERAGALSPKSIRNAHGVLSALLGLARFDELIADNAAKGLPPETLPANTKVRQTAAWTRDECERFISDERIPEDRRVLYAIAAFTGARLGEACGLRWRDLDQQATPLWRWSLRTQWDGKPLKGKGAAGGPPRDIPIHPELAKLLAAWRLGGWARHVGRVARPDDFVVPDEHGGLLTKNAGGSKAVHRHAAKIGIDPGNAAIGARDFHSFRRAFITTAQTDGAHATVLERVTHNAKGEMIDRYTYFGWEPLCAAVACVRLAPRSSGNVVPMRRPRAAGDELVDVAAEPPPDAPGSTEHRHHVQAVHAAHRAAGSRRERVTRVTGAETDADRTGSTQRADPDLASSRSAQRREDPANAKISAGFDSRRLHLHQSSGSAACDPACDPGRIARAEAVLAGFLRRKEEALRRRARLAAELAELDQALAEAELEEPIARAEVEAARAGLPVSSSRS